MSKETTMSLAYKIIAALLLLSGSFIAGYHTRVPTTVVETKIETKEVEKIITKRIIEKETKPDGTVKETVTENITSNNTSKRKEDVPVKQLDPQYLIGVQYGLSHDMDYVPDNVYVGRRLLGPVWGTAGYSIEHKQLLIGVQVEF
jgi:hypothetical protein